MFISGPVVVSSQQNILFTTILPPKSNPLGTKWFKIQNNTYIEINFDANGYEKRTLTGDIITQSVEIPNAPENFCEYQLCLEGMKSNKINVYLEGTYSVFSCFYVKKGV